MNRNELINLVQSISMQNGFDPEELGLPQVPVQVEETPEERHNNLVERVLFSLNSLGMTNFDQFNIATRT